MYCAIRTIGAYNFSGEINDIKEEIYEWRTTNLEYKLKFTKEEPNKQFVFLIIPSKIHEFRDDIERLCKARPNVSISIVSHYRIGENIIKGARYFYSFGAMNADSLEKMKMLINHGVTQVYVTGELAFKMEEARALADRHNIKLRVVPNVAQVSGFGLLQSDYAVSMGEGVKSFWIRPNDLCLYEKYIDVIEFFCEGDKQSTYFDIYFQSKKWSGCLSEIIIGLQEPVDNRGLLSSFTEGRLNCGKKCLLDKCHRCDRYAVAAKMLEELRLEAEVDQ